MYIAPNSTIWILKGIPLDPTYDHTIYWDSVQQQIAYFTDPNNTYGHVKYKKTKQSYQRVQRGYINIDIKAEDLYDCNYIVFLNDSFGTKHFYAFLKSVEYVNNSVSRIEFEIDVMQTWFFDYEMEQCFVEREHSTSDGLFENLVVEDVNLGNEYVANSVEQLDMNEMNLCILANRQLAGGSQQIPPTEIINNIVMPLRIYEDISVSENNISRIDSIFNDFNESDIVCVYQYPKAIYKKGFPDISVAWDVDVILPVPEIHTIPFTVVGDPVEINALVGYKIQITSEIGGSTYTEEYTITANTGDTLTVTPALQVSIYEGTPIVKVNDSYGPDPVFRKILTINNTLNGYTPRNKKLFSYPYNKIIVSNNCGQDAEFKWEYLHLNAQGQAFFQAKGSVVSTPAVLCFPEHYKNVTMDYDSGLIYSNFPQCCWSGDVFKAWWAQNKASFVTSTLTSVLSSASSGVMTGLTSSALSASPNVGVGVGGAAAISNIAGTVANSVAKIEDIKNSPSQTHGQAQTDSLNPALGRVRFTFYLSSINSQYAAIIDDYFDRYGYATKRNKTPNRKARTHWTFTKTAGCTIKGSIPADDAKTICNIYNSGITFWVTPSEVGNYNLTNAPITV